MARFEGAAELQQANIFALEKRDLAPPAHQRPKPRPKDPWEMETDGAKVRRAEAVSLWLCCDALCYGAP